MELDSGWSAIDAGLARWIYGLTAPAWTAEAVTHLVTRGGVVVVAALAMLAFGRGRTRRTGVALAAGLAAHVLLLELAVKNIVARERPFAALGLTLRDALVDPTSHSFPSGHSAAAFMGAWIVGARFPRWRAPLFLAACAVAVSRVHLAAHYPTDVLAGAVFGLGLGVAAARFCGVTVSDGTTSGGEYVSVDQHSGSHLPAEGRVRSRRALHESSLRSEGEWLDADPEAPLEREEPEAGLLTGQRDRSGAAEVPPGTIPIVK